MPVDEKGLEAACRAAWPEGFSDDPHVAHRACSPCDVKHWQDGSRERVRAIITAYESARSAEPVAWGTPDHGRRVDHPMPVEPAAEFMGMKVLVNPQLPPDAAYIESRRPDGSVD